MSLANGSTRRGVLIAAILAAIFVAAFAAAPAGAHPLGNFSVNHLTTVRVSDDRVELRWVLDQAEIPTFQERGRPRANVLADKIGEARRRIEVVIDGKRAALGLAPGARIGFLPGQGGLPTTRVEATLVAPAERASLVEVRDGTFPGRVGWKAVVAAPGKGTAVRSSAPSGDPTGGLRRYPRDTLSSPLDQREGRFDVRPGNGTLVAPRAPGGERVTTGDRGGGDGFAGIFGRAAAGEGALAFLLLASLAWGAVHALSPGHGKAMVAAYLVGTRGTARHALALGATVTVTHTIGVFALGVVTLMLSQYVLPEDLYPWLNLASGLLVVIIGLGVLRSRARVWRAKKGDAGDDHHTDGHEDGHGHHGHDHQHAHGHDGHGHHHHLPDRLTWRGLLGMGASAGLIPCPSALVVLLAAVAQHQVALGLLLIVVFSLGLAGTLSVLGLLVVHAGRAASLATGRLGISRRVVAALPAVSALVIVGVGVMLTARAVPALA